MNRQNTARLFTATDFPLIGESPAITEVKELIGKIAPADTNVLILGETGTGKEIVANSIHHQSRRSRGPFVAVNCPALAVTVIDSELFGHKKGSFTGALTDRMGRFEFANGGTIFLDEIGDLPLPMQAKLLRSLEEREIQRVGENHNRPFDCRVVAATNVDLETACRKGTFREDLYYRLAVTKIRLPRLRDHIEDIPLLVDHFLGKLAQEKYGAPFSKPRISDEAMDAIISYSFPGNVRELRDSIRGAIVISAGKTISLEDLPENIRQGFEGNSAAPAPRSRPSARLFEALEKCLSRDAGLPGNIRPKSIRTVKIEDIARFLSGTGGREFSRKEFELFLRRQRSNGINKSAYATAGRYLRAMVEKGVIEHNGGKANKSRFRVSEDYLLET